MRMVLKFGGSSLASPQHVCRAAKLAAALAKKGHQVVVVVSAQGDTTDEMIEKAKAISPCPAPSSCVMPPSWRQSWQRSEIR